MGQSTVKISNGVSEYYGTNVGPYAIVLDNGYILNKSDLEAENSMFKMSEDTSGTVEVTEELQAKADRMNMKYTDLRYLTERFGEGTLTTAPDEYENEEEV